MIIKIISFSFSMCILFSPRNLASMGLLESVKCSGNVKIHPAVCARCGRPSDWNRFARVSANLSLEANKIWLMTLFISDPNDKGCPTGNAGLRRKVHCIDRMRIEIEMIIKEILKLVNNPFVRDYIVGTDYGRFIKIVGDMGQSWNKKKQLLLQWFVRIAHAQDINSCMKLENEFNEVHKKNIETAYYEFCCLLDIGCQKCLCVRLIANDRSGDLIKSDDSCYDELFREYLSSSLQEKKSYFDGLKKILEAVIEFESWQTSRSIIFTQLKAHDRISNKKDIFEKIYNVRICESLIKARINTFNQKLRGGMLRKTLKNEFLLKTLVGAVQEYGNIIGALIELTRPPVAAFSVACQAGSVYSVKSRTNQRVPLLNLSSLPL